MPWHVWNLRFAGRAAAAFALSSCIGCWQEIEYTGPRTTVSQSPAKHEGIKGPEVPAATEPELPSESVATEPAPPRENVMTDAPAITNSVVAHANPPATGKAEASAPAVEPAPPSEIVGDRYAATPAADGPPTAASPLPPDSTKPVDAATPKVEPAAPQAVVPTNERPSDPTATTPAITAPPAAASPASEPPLGTSTVAMASKATAPAAPPGPALTSRRAAWLLGSRLSLAALANDRGVAAKNVPAWYQDAEVAAKYLGTSLTPLPEAAPKTDNGLASNSVINYLVANGQRIGRDISKQQSLEPAALFEVALKSNILLLLYTPGSAAGNSISAAISQAAPHAKIPNELWQPLVAALDKQASQSDIRAAVRKLHVDVDHYLAQEAGQGGR